MRKLSRRSPYFLRKFHFPRGKGNMTGLEQKKRLPMGAAFVYHITSQHLLITHSVRRCTPARSRHRCR